MIPHSAIRNAIRKLWLWSPERKAALKRARWNGHKKLFRCEVCYRPTNKPEVNHRIAVGKTPGARGSSTSDTWNELIERLFCGESGLQITCKICHTGITKSQKAKP